MTDPSDPWARSAQQPPQPYQPHPGNPTGPQYGGPPTQGPPTQGYPPSGPPTAGPSADETEPGGRFTRFVRDPLSIVLVVVIVLALGAAGLIGGEIYARHRGDQVVSAAVSCVVQDTATASFGAMPPFLWQHMTKHYDNISVTTAGNQIREIKGMKAEININDIRLQNNGTSTGTIGALNATLSWSTEGISQTIQNSIPIIGSFVSGVKTNPSDGTIELQAALGSIVVKPEVVDNGVALQVQKLTGLGFTLPRETVQPALDAFSGQLTKNYPLGIHADSVEVTDTGVIAKFSTQNASMPASDQDPCFAGL
ncbi:LmeA family phospholipid-binding protein [Mycolicibacterium hodleri]|uniref:DUF2993 domain-containing protein n=1 Tax=Mycolicibacterium hodleri TaxID=49897 RepID=A0A502E514_9MYCO|nr:DUF2993 domain-containing protein [Mycolicibacterium hodleri]TPG31520.1 DUF2993 domain-containing protein [Mycolicibacterium hodleri]